MDLTHWISSAGRLSSEDAVGWALRLAKTLAVLHPKGLAHGRISPNAVEADGPECDAEAVLRPASRVTEDDAYLSTERLAGAAPTPADDVWAVGVLLYRALTGQLPFVDTAVSGQQPMALVNAVGAELAAIQPVFDRVFHRDRAERIVTAHDLVTVLSAHHPRAGQLAPLELPTESIRLAHRVKHVSQPLLEAVRQEENALSTLLGGTAPSDESDSFDDDEPRRDSENVFLGWLSEPPPRAAESAAPAAGSRDDSLAADDELDDDWEDDEDDRPTLMRPLAPSLEPFDELPAAAAAPGEEPELALDGEPDEEPESQPVAAGPAVSTSDEVAEVSERQAAAAPARRSAKRSSPAALWLLVGGLGILVVAFGVLRRGSGQPSGGPAGRSAPSSMAAGPATGKPSALPAVVAPTAPPPLAASPSGAAATPRPTAASSAPALSSVAVPAAASATSSAPVAPPAVGDRDACMLAFFPPDTFAGDEPQSFEGVCRRGHPRKGAEAIKGLVVAAGNRRALTAGMKEWSLLGWYSLAAFAVVHGHCCESAIDLSHPSFKVCGLGDALAALHGAARGRVDELAAGTVAYQKAASCTWRSANAKMFQQTTPPTSQQLATYQKIVDRLKP